MNNKRRFPGFFSGLLLLSVVLGFGSSLAAQEVEPRFDTLTVGTNTYRHVVVQNQTATNIFFRHSQGLASARLRDLDAETQDRLGYVPPQEVPVLSLGEQAVAFLRQSLSGSRAGELLEQLEEKYADEGARAELRAHLPAALAVALVVYLFYCFCLHKICIKARTQPGPLVWVPFLQMIPMHRAATIPPGLVVLYLVPLANLAVGLLWAVKLCRARGKSPLLVVLLFVPGLNLLFIPILAYTR